jgi:sugar phosphate permease
VVLTRALQAGSFFAAETILLVTLQDLRGLTPFDVGLALTVGSVGWTLGSWLQSQGWVRLTRDAFITLGAIASSTGIAVIVVFAWVPSIHLFVGLLGWVISGLGMGLTMPSSAVAVMALSTQFEQGRHQSSMQVAESIGNAVITAVAGGLYTALLAAEPQKLSYTTALSATLVLSLAAVVLSRRIGRIANELHA